MVKWYVEVYRKVETFTDILRFRRWLREVYNKRIMGFFNQNVNGLREDVVERWPFNDIQCVYEVIEDRFPSEDRFNVKGMSRGLRVSFSGTFYTDLGFKGVGKDGRYRVRWH